jgi:hypothetical protein
LIITKSLKKFLKSFGGRQDFLKKFGDLDQSFQKVDEGREKVWRP